MDTLGSPFWGSLEQGWNQSVTESSSSGFTSVTINQMLDELIDSRNKLSIQSFKLGKRVPGNRSSGISETHWVSVGFVIRGEPSQPVGTEGFTGVGEDWWGSGGPARRMLGRVCSCMWLVHEWAVCVSIHVCGMVGCVCVKASLRR